MVPHPVSLLRLAVLALMILGAAPGQADEPPVSASLYQAMQWRGIGPYRGGRALAVAGVPGDPYRFYFGAVAGGVWKTIDAGANWTPIFDSQPMSSIGAIAVAPSNPDVIYVGTGEGAPRGDITYGDGVYKTTDGGKSWTHVGLADSRQIGAVIVDPKNPDIALVAAIGHAFGPNQERGLFRTSDGGKSWKKVLYKDENTGAIDVTYDPNNANIVYAALWQARRQPWNFSSGGPGSGLYRSTDGGESWSEVKGNGLPAGILGKIDIAVSGADSNRVYAMIEAEQGGLYRSDDAGVHWVRINEDGRLRQRAWYFSKIYADPKDKDTVIALNTGMLRSTDGGKRFDLVAARHGDHHGLWIDPTDPKRMINANDGGASVTLDGGATWSSQNNQPTAQFYHVAVDQRFPYWVYGAQQDNSNLATASFDDEGVITERSWYPAGGGESGFVIPDPRDALIIYSDAENQIVRYDKRREQVQDISAWPFDSSGHPAGELDHRFNWTAPLALSPHNPDRLYVTSEVVWQSDDHGNSWTIISPDLTRNDKSKQQASGGPLTKDITSVEYYDTIFAFAESPLVRGMLWAGSDDGLVHVSKDGGAHWSDVTPKDLPEWGTVSMIDPSPSKPDSAYLAVDRHRLDDIRPYAWKTRDAGKSWVAITDGLPAGAIVHAVREDPKRAGLLYAGTEMGVFVSFDDGGHWQSLQLNLPATPIHDLLVKGDDLVVATHGRSFWILDDLTPLRQIKSDDAAQPMLLFKPQTALRLSYPDEVDTRRPAGQNPPAGALIDYYFKDKPSDDVTVDILDGQGKLVRHLSSTKTSKEEQPPEWPDRIVPSDLIPAKAGMNRLVWDLRMTDPEQIPGAFYSGNTPRAARVVPGSYQVRLTSGGKSLMQPITVAVDPRAPGSEKAIKAKVALEVAAVADIDRLHHAVNELRTLRKTLQEVSAKAPPARQDEIAAALSKMDPIEQQLIQVNMKGSEANLAFPGMLNELFASFAGSQEDADTAPTAQHKAMFDKLHKRLDAQLAAWNTLRPTLTGLAQ